MDEKNEQGKTVTLPRPEGGEMGLTEMDLIAVPPEAMRLERVVERTEKQIEVFKKIRVICLRLTNERDWLYQGDGLSLNETGAQKMGIAWGMDINCDKIDLEWVSDDRGRYYIYTATGRGYSKKLGRMIEDIGTCSSRDDFFGKIGKEWKKLEDVDMTDVKKKAVTNLYRRLITRCLGLSNVTEAELASAGLDLTKIEKVLYGEDRKKAEAELTPELLGKRGEIEKIALELAHGDRSGMKPIIKAASTWQDKEKNDVFREDVRDIKTERWIGMTLDRIKGTLKKEMPDVFAKLYPPSPAASAPAQTGKGSEKKEEPKK